jgi:PHP family Zn ribbon phosphoesterase
MSVGVFCYFAIIHFMKQYIADLHFHSPYSRACSKDLTLENTDKIAKEKGIQIIGTNDFCQAKWLKECEEKLIEIRPGIYQLKENSHGVNYIFTNEISCIYKHVGAVRRLHLCL